MGGLLYLCSLRCCCGSDLFNFCGLLFLSHSVIRPCLFFFMLMGCDFDAISSFNSLFQCPCCYYFEIAFSLLLASQGVLFIYMIDFKGLYICCP